MSGFLPEGYCTLLEAARRVAAASGDQWAAAILSQDEVSKLRDHRNAIALLAAGERIEALQDAIERSRFEQLEKARRAAPIMSGGMGGRLPVLSRAQADRLHAAHLVTRKARFLSVATEDQLTAWGSAKAAGTLGEIRAAAAQTDEIDSILRREGTQKELLQMAWQRLRQSLYSGRLVGYTFQEDGHLSAVEPHRWGSRAYESPIGWANRLLLSEPELSAFLTGRLTQTIHDNTPSEPLRTGAPGRPSSMHLVRAEFERRCAAGEVGSVLTAESRILATWFKQKYPDHQSPTPKGIENDIRGDFKRYRASRAAPQKSP